MRSVTTRHEPEYHPLAKTHDVDFARPYFGQEEFDAVNTVMNGYWLANGKENEQFEREFAQMVGVPYALCVNSGSSANLIALAALDLKPFSKVLTSGCGFPATLAPIIHLGFEPVLIDYDRATCNISLSEFQRNIANVQAVILAHTMGNPVNMSPIMASANYFNVPVIEDCCEAVGATYGGKPVGGIGEMGTFSFYPSHQITALGGGGMVTFKDENTYVRAKSLRDWGKADTAYGRQNTEYTADVDGIPYFPAYSSIGWNMKLPEANAAFGREQLKRLDWIVQERRKNHDMIFDLMRKVDVERLRRVYVPLAAEPSWFGVLLTPTTCTGRELGEELEKRGVRHRPFFAGNITRHEPFKAFSVPLPQADFLMKQTIFVGCYAGMTEEDCAYVAKAIGESLDAVRSQL